VTSTGGFDGLSGARQPRPPAGIATVPGPDERNGRTRVVLVRHGEAVCNVSGICGGEIGCTGLTEVGRAQVVSLRDRLAETGELVGCTALYASVLARARETAEILAPALLGPGEPVRVRGDLRELHPGEADGLTWSEYADRFGGPDWTVDPSCPIAPGGESWTGFVRRVADALDDLVLPHRGDLVVVACHAGVIEASLLAKLPVTGGLDGARLQLHTHHASMTSWEVDGEEVDGGEWRLLAYNDALTSAAAIPDASLPSLAARQQA
jgi:2,3-bisphosphoglycerate-dependent phosphoglycerate mutase